MKLLTVLMSVFLPQHVPLLSETLRMLASNDLSAADYPYAAGSQVRPPPQTMVA